MRWTLGRAPWVLHSVPLLGNLTDRWIETQALAAARYDSRVLGLQIAPDARRQAHWLVAEDRLDLWLAYKGMFKSGGLSTAWLATQLRANPPALIHAHYGPPAARHRHLARALKNRPDARLLMLGAGGLEPMLRNIASEGGVTQQVTWAGVLPFKQFMGALSEASVALYPSRRAQDGDSEGGAPVTLIEAQ